MSGIRFGPFSEKPCGLTAFQVESILSPVSQFNKTTPSMNDDSPTPEETDKTPIVAAAPRQRSAFESAYLEYVRSIFKTYSEFQQRAADNYENCARELNQTYADLQKVQEDAKRSYLTSMQEAFGREDAQPRADTAYRNYCNQVQENFDASKVRAEEMMEKINSLLKQGTEEAQGRFAQAITHYFEQFQAAVTQLDIAQLRQTDLAAISQTLGAVVFYSGLTQALRQ